MTLRCPDERNGLPLPVDLILRQQDHAPTPRERLEQSRVNERDNLKQEQ